MGKFLLDLTLTFETFYKKAQSFSLERQRKLTILNSEYWAYVVIVLMTLTGFIISKKRDKLFFWSRGAFYLNSLAKDRLLYLVPPL